MKWVVQEVAQRAGIKNAKELSERAGIHLKSAYGIWKNESRRLDLDTLDRLCTLLNVKPGQLFDHVAEPELLPGGSGEPSSVASSGTSTKSKSKSKPSRQAIGIRAAAL